MEARLERRRRRRTLQSIALISLLVLAAGFLFWYETSRTLTLQDNVLELVMVYGSEKRSWIERVIPDFEEEWLRNHPSRPIVVHCVPMGSRESMNQILHGQTLPTIWSPASSIWIPMANQLWEEMYPHYVEERGPLIKEWKPLVHSPIVIITWQEYANKFNLTGLQSLHTLAVSEDKGQLKFAHTDPQLSNSGMMVLLLEVAAAVRKAPSELVMEDLTDNAVKTWLKELEARSVYYGRSTGFLVEKMVNEGPERMNVIGAYENLIIEKNRGGEPLQHWGQRLIAVYPEEGTLSSDHPFCILNAPWTDDPFIREAAKELLQFLLREDVQAKAVEYGFRPENKEVPLDPSIFNENYGVRLEVPCSILESDVRGDVLWRITDLWLVCRTYG